MARFQLVFRDDDGDRSEIRDDDLSDEPQIDGRVLVDSEAYVIGGVEWRLRREDVGEMPRFVCSPVFGRAYGGGADLVLHAAPPVWEGFGEPGIP